jgi:hypothetical protein
MQRGVEDADDIEAVVCLFVDDNIGETGNGEFMRSICGVTAAGESIEHSIYDAMMRAMTVLAAVGLSRAM